MVISQEKKSGIQMCCTMEKIAWFTLNFQLIAAVAQSVERLACMHIVRCSSPSYDRPKLLNEVLTVPIPKYVLAWQDYFIFVTAGTAL